MKGSLITILLLCLMLPLFAGNGIIWTDSSFTDAQILRAQDEGMSVRFNLGNINFEELSNNEGEWTELSVSGYTFTNEPGLPKLPLLRKIISLPLEAELDINIVHQEVQNIKLEDYGIFSPIMPTQPGVAKNKHSDLADFVINHDFYKNNSHTEQAPLQFTELGILRSERLFALDYLPINYDMAKGELNIVHALQAELRFINANHRATSELRAKAFSPAFHTVLKSNIWNYSHQRDMVLRHPISYVIIAPQAFLSPMQPFIEWKTQEGYKVIVKTIEEIGNNQSAIKNYMQGLWDNASPQSPAPSYLLLVGDVAQVATGSSSTFDTHPTDLHYVCLEGDDFFPEIYFGRFSATTVEQVENQVYKTLLYSQFAMPDPSYLQDTILIAGVDVTWAPTHGNTQINYAVDNYFNPAHNINSHNFYHPQSGSNASNIRSLVSQGAGYVNYTAHGYTMEWSNPLFTNSQVLALQNHDKPAFVVGNCCLTAKFDINVCFAEAWLRADNAGAVVYIGATNNTYWHEDYWWSVGAKGIANGITPTYDPTKLGMYDAQFHDNNEAFEDWVHSAGAMIMMGNLAVVQGNSAKSDYYWEVYTVMGDPSVIPYAGIPEINDITLPQYIFTQTDAFEIHAAPHSYIALSMNNTLHGVGLTDENGYLLMQHSPFTEAGTAQIVATRSRKRPAIVELDVIPIEGAYITVSNLESTEGNSEVYAGGSTDMNLSFTNMGVIEATNLSFSIDSASDWIYISDLQDQLPDISPGESFTHESAFVLHAHKGAPDQLISNLFITVTNGIEQWTSIRTVKINAPGIVISSIDYSDPNNNNIFEPGETITLTINATNIGSLPVDGGELELILNSDIATLSQSQFSIAGMNTGESISQSFDLEISQDAEERHAIALGIALDMDSNMINHCEIIPVGTATEGFESGDFSALAWENDASFPWVIDDSQAHQGTYSARSGAISHNQRTDLKFTINIPARSEIRFARKVSSEDNYDKLNFYIDYILKDSWSGELDWEEVSYVVNPGVRTFRWEYRKDISNDGGSDAAWIDSIHLPLTGAQNIPIAYTNTESITFSEVAEGEYYQQSFVLRNLGNGSLQGSITVPDQFVLKRNGVTLTSPYEYSLTPASTNRYTIGFYAQDITDPIHEELLISTNDAFSPLISIPITIKSTSNEDITAPFITDLKGNYPNPFNPNTMIRFSLRDASLVQIKVYNLRGQLIRELFKDQMSAGSHQVAWDGKDQRGSAVSSGIYFYQMETDGYKATRKMMLMK